MIRDRTRRRFARRPVRRRRRARRRGSRHCCGRPTSPGTGRRPPGPASVLRVAFARLSNAAADGQRHFAFHSSAQAFGEEAGPFQVGLRHDHDELFAAVAGDDVGFAGAFVEQPRQLLQHLVAVEVPLLVVDPLEMIDVENRQGESRPVAVHHGELPGDGVGHAAAVVHAGQGVRPHLGERHQVGALLADFVVGIGDLRGQMERRLEDVLRFAAQFFPSGLVTIVAELAHSVAELADAGMVFSQILPQVPCDLLQLRGDQLRRRISRRERYVPSGFDIFERRPKR